MCEERILSELGALREVSVAHAALSLAVAKCSGQPSAEPSLADVVAELKAIRQLLEMLADGSVAIRTRPATL